LRLIIAEKPSMAGEIAKCLPNPIRKTGYYQTDDGNVTWSFGHILQMADPQDYDSKYEKWRMEDLPIIPENWKQLVSPSCKDQFKIIKELISQSSEIVHAGDPDREGQLLIDEILDYVKNTKPVKRILLNALDEKSIRKALRDLRNNEDFYTLLQSAIARSCADWLIGMNLSRAYTIAAQKAGHSVTLPIGRVKTPTIALVVRREEEIKNFKTKVYYLVRAVFQHQNGAFEGEWQPNENQIHLDTEGRLTDKTTADEIIKKLRAEKETAIITDCTTTKKSDPQRLPFSLSALQIEAGKKYGYDPQTVLTTAQILYEKKLTTYPRSDCDFLPENQLSSVSTIIENLKKINHIELSLWAAQGNVSIKSRAWNDKKITAHHAIIPTEVFCDYSKLTEIEKNIYFLIAQAYMSQFYPVHEYEQTKIEIMLADEIFTVTGHVVIVEGWKRLYRQTKEEKEDDPENDGSKELPKIDKNDPAKYMSGYVLEKKTKPPSRFTSSSLLQAMKEIHKYVKNQELKKQLKDVSGIGTEATRASIIKEIMDKGFLIEEKKFLRPSDQAYLMVSLLPDELTYPDATAEWEMTFEKIVEGKLELDVFLARQTQFITMLCQKATNLRVKQAEGQSCPTCQQGILRSKNSKGNVFWGCSRFPDCKATYSDKKGKPDLEPPMACPVCTNGILRKIPSKNGEFWACNNVDCKETFSNNRNKPQIIKCPVCNCGYLKQIPSKNGPFWSCSEYKTGCKATYKDSKGKPQMNREGKK
jgi:DNA topoisomerase-3